MILRSSELLRGGGVVLFRISRILEFILSVVGSRNIASWARVVLLVFGLAGLAHGSGSAVGEDTGATAPLEPALNLLSLDAQSQRAVLRQRGGRPFVVARGDVLPHGAMRVFAIYSDRMLLESAEPGKRRSRFWLQAGRDGAGRLLSMESRPPNPEDSPYRPVQVDLAKQKGGR